MQLYRYADLYRWMMNTRVAVPLSQEAYEAVSFLAKVGKTSRGKILADAVSAALPSLQRTAQIYQAAIQAEAGEREAMLEAFVRAEKHLLDALATSLPDYPDPDHASDGPAGGALDRGDGPSDPPDTNRGVPVFRSGGSA